MTKETITRIKLTASKGTTLTNGTTFGKKVYLSTSDTDDNWQEITDEEAAKIKEEKAKSDLAAVGGD